MAPPLVRLAMDVQAGHVAQRLGRYGMHGGGAGDAQGRDTMMPQRPGIGLAFDEQQKLVKARLLQFPQAVSAQADSFGPVAAFGRLEGGATFDRDKLVVARPVGDANAGRAVLQAELVEECQRQTLVLRELGHGERGMRHDGPSREMWEKEMGRDVCETRKMRSGAGRQEADLRSK